MNEPALFNDYLSSFLCFPTVWCMGRWIPGGERPSENWLQNCTHYEELTTYTMAYLKTAYSIIVRLKNTTGTFVCTILNSGSFSS